nr:transposase [Mesorhizobium sp. L2C054A000]
MCQGVDLETVEFATKPKMARAMVEAALDAGVPCAYVQGDAVYGADSSLRRMLEAREQPYVLAVRGARFMRRGGDRRFEGTSPEELASELAPEDWVCHAAGEGAKGPRRYDWAHIRRPWASKGGFGHLPRQRTKWTVRKEWSGSRPCIPWARTTGGAMRARPRVTALVVRRKRSTSGVVM